MKLSMTLGRTSDGIALDDVVLVPNHWWERVLLRLHLLRFSQMTIEYRDITQVRHHNKTVSIRLPEGIKGSIIESINKHTTEWGVKIG